MVVESGMEQAQGAFRARVMDALSQYDAMCRKKIGSDAPLPRLSISGFLKSFHISRSSLYRNHKSLISEIETCFRAIEQERKDSKTRVKPTVASLQREIIELRKKVKFERADYTSRQLVTLLERMGPMFRSKQQAALEKQAMERLIFDLEERLSRRDALIYNLTRQLNEKNTKG